MHRIDQEAINRYQIPGQVLMENAGAKVVQTLIHNFEESMTQKTVIVVVGKGNNGGDGLVVARHLINKGVDTKVFILSKLKDIRGDSANNLKILKNMGIPLYYLTEEKDLNKLKIGLVKAHFVVDAIFGTGFKGASMGVTEQAIDIINRSEAKVIAVDVPSGVESSTGKVHGSCIKADYTITFGFPKLGFFMHNAADFLGQLTVVDISIPYWLPEQLGIKRKLVTADEVISMFPKRNERSHKGTFGHVAVVGGSEGMTGAACLTGQAALSIGAGIVNVGVPASLNPIVEQKLTEVMSKPLPETQSKSLSREALEPINSMVESSSVLALGPGLSSHSETMSLVRTLLPQLKKPIVLDADGINALAENIDILGLINEPVVITPHPGEMARLLKTTVAKVEEDRVGVASKFAAKWGVTVVLKGNHSIVAAADGRVYLNISGNNGMATAGSGDVLTGFIAGLIAQGLDSVEASVLGTYLHGAAGDMGVKEKRVMALLAGDIISYLPKVLQELEV